MARLWGHKARKNPPIRTPEERAIHEEKMIEKWLQFKLKRPDTRAFMARPNRGVGANRSVMLVGCSSRGWFQAIKFWNEDHEDRCRVAIEKYNSFEAGRPSLEDLLK